jgi:hypothetical protein
VSGCALTADGVDWPSGSRPVGAEPGLLLEQRRSEFLESGGRVVARDDEGLSGRRQERAPGDRGRAGNVAMTGTRSTSLPSPGPPTSIPCRESASSSSALGRWSNCCTFVLLVTRSEPETSRSLRVSRRWQSSSQRIATLIPFGEQAAAELEHRLGRLPLCRPRHRFTIRRGRGGSLCGWCPEAWSPLSLWAPGADLPRPYLRQAFLAKPRDVAQQHSLERGQSSGGSSSAARIVVRSEIVRART